MFGIINSNTNHIFAVAAPGELQALQNVELLFVISKSVSKQRELKTVPSMSTG